MKPGTPAQIVHRCLLDQSPTPQQPYLPVVVDATSGKPWGLFISETPDTPDECVTVYDTAGVTDGRIQRTGAEVVHPGIQFRIRSRKYTDGWSKAVDIVNALTLTYAPTVVLNGNAYTLQCAKLVSPILHLGYEPGTKRRELFTINYILTILELYG